MVRSLSRLRGPSLPRAWGGTMRVVVVVADRTYSVDEKGSGVLVVSLVGICSVDRVRSS